MLEEGVNFLMYEEGMWIGFLLFTSWCGGTISFSSPVTGSTVYLEKGREESERIGLDWMISNGELLVLETVTDGNLL